MLIDFFLELRKSGVDVSAHEWLTLMQALDKGLHDSSLDGFYQVARAVCVKEVGQLDAFDVAFLAYFKDIRFESLAFAEQLLAWLEDPRGLSDAERKFLESLDIEELRRRFEERLREQRERHDGGNRWIGTGGTSPFGQAGQHPTGLRAAGSGAARPCSGPPSAASANTAATWCSTCGRSIWRCAGCAASAARALRRSWTSTRPSPAPRRTAASSSSPSGRPSATG